MFPFRLHIIRLNPYSVSLFPWDVFPPCLAAGLSASSIPRDTAHHSVLCGRVISHCMGSSPTTSTLEHLCSAQQHDIAKSCSLCNPQPHSHLFFWQLNPGCVCTADCSCLPHTHLYWTTSFSQAFSPSFHPCLELSFCPFPAHIFHLLFFIHKLTCILSISPSSEPSADALLFNVFGHKGKNMWCFTCHSL